MASYKKYPTTTQPDPIAGASEANVLRARAARYKQLSELMTDPRVIHEVQACALELEADAARIESAVADIGVGLSPTGETQRARTSMQQRHQSIARP